MSDAPSSNLPWAEQYRVVAKEYVALKAAADMLEECKSATLAKRMAALGDMPVSRAEMSVKASDEWADYIKTMVSAREQAELKRVHLEYIRMKFQEWSSANATQRAEMRLAS
jgi:predicted hydrolase (HD superfamily)